MSLSPIHCKQRGKGADQFVGRVAALLDLMSEEFAVLPPHFVGNDPYVQEAVKECFPGLYTKGDNMPAVLEMCLASVVYHARPGGYLHTKLPGGDEYDGDSTGTSARISLTRTR